MWFRGWHELFSTTLVKAFSAESLDVTQLLHELPRHRADYRTQLDRARDVPLEGFTDGTALDMVCYLALQALPRHSRVYSNVYLAGEWHDMIELRAVQQVAPEHDPVFEKANSAMRRQQKQTMDVMSALEAADNVRVSRHQSEDPELDPDYRGPIGAHRSASPDGYAPIAREDAAAGVQPAQLSVLARAIAYEPLAGLLPRFVREWMGVGREVHVAEEVVGVGPSWIYIDDSGNEQGPFTTLRMRRWVVRSPLRTWTPSSHNPAG